MNKLEIAQKVNTLAGTQGDVDSVEAPLGYQQVLVQMVDQAYADIQRYRKDWKFMRVKAQAALSDTLFTITNTEIQTVDRVIYDDRVLREISDERWVLMSFNATEPKVYTVDDTTRIITLNDLDTNYIVDYWYYRIPHEMTLNVDEPILPEEFHDAIVYKALIDLGSFLGNYDLVTYYGTKYSMILGDMMRSELAQKRLKHTPRNTFVRGERY